MARSTWAAVGVSVLAVAMTSVAAQPAPANADAKQFSDPEYSAAPVGSRGVGAVPLAPGSGFRKPAGSRRVRILQRRLARLGDAPGPIDGRYGPHTTAAVIRFQEAQGLQVDGVAGPQTLTRLRILSKHVLGAARARARNPAGVRAAQPPVAQGSLIPGLIGGRSGPVPAPLAHHTPPAGRNGLWSVLWPILAGLIAAVLLLTISARLRRRSDGWARPRRNISPRMLALAGLAGFRYSPGRNAYVLRLVGGILGPVLSPSAPEAGNAHTNYPKVSPSHEPTRNSPPQATTATEASPARPRNEANGGNRANGASHESQTKPIRLVMIPHYWRE